MSAARRALGAVFALTLTISGLSGCALLGGSPTVTASPPAASPSAGAKSGSVGAVTPKLPKAPPAPSLAAAKGRSWATVVPALLAYGQWLLASADSTSVPNDAAPGCSFDDALMQQTSAEAADGTVLQTAPLTILSIQGVAGPVGTETTLSVEVSRRSEQYVSAAGGAGVANPPLPPTFFAVTLDLGTDKQWRICSIAKGEESDQLTTTPPPLQAGTDGEEALAIL